MMSPNPPSETSGSPENSPSEQVSAASEALLQERRLSRIDRRQNSRQGKFDRRRNRCTHCVHFKVTQTEQTEANKSSSSGFCSKHHEPMTAETYACWVFELASEQPRDM
ncbi:MAG: hypothetical protein VKK59_01065 [Vampirovibrionales bacterium]|nr:hypothetical protein [Vampirovibrionales bacterium]